MNAQDNIPLCPNCSAEVNGNYCSDCGQKNQRLRQPLLYFIREAFAEYFGIDGRFWKTIGNLILRPGQLTIEYVAGRRRSYLRPLRIYLLATVFFFFLISIMDPVKNIENTTGFSWSISSDTTATVESRLQTIALRIRNDNEELNTQIGLVDSLTALYANVSMQMSTDSLNGVAADLLAENQDIVLDALGDRDDEVDDLEELIQVKALRKKRFDWQTTQLESLPADSVITPSTYHDAAVQLFPDESAPLGTDLPDWVPENSLMRLFLGTSTNEEMQEGVGPLMRQFIDKLPAAVFLMLPFFALLMKIFYARRDWFYTEHLVFGLHTHAFAFLVFAIMAITTAVSDGKMWSDYLNVFLILAILIYFFVAVKRVYQQGWIKTFLKCVLLGSAYNFVLLIGFLAALFVAALLGT